MIEQLAQIVANFDPWWMIAIAIALVLLDWTLIHTEAFLTVSIAIFFMALVNAVDLAPVVQLWLYPVALLGSYFLQRRFYETITNVDTPYKLTKSHSGTIAPLDTRIGEIGTLKVLTSKNESTDHFFAYKEKMHLETKEINDTSVVLKVELSDGSVFPARYTGTIEVYDGLRVKVASVQDGALVTQQEG